jgi:hypothetical protein
VFQAEQLSLGKMVALKLLRRELQTDEKLIKRFELEAKNASSLDHPNSIQIIDFGRDEELLYIAMELLPGVDLGQLILREGPLPFSRLGRIMDQVLGALDEAHAHGIVHRDLKPGNIMLVSRRDDPDFVKVCDFGIAKAQSSTEGAGLTLKGLVCGTPEYMSPEQARGEDVDGRSDLYSVGVILYQLVTGELPFSASSPVGILSKHLAEPPMPPSLRKPGLSIPPALESVILHALAKEPADRPRSAEHLRRALRHAVSGLVDNPTTPGGGQRMIETFDALAAQSTTPIGLAAHPRRATPAKPSAAEAPTPASGPSFVPTPLPPKPRRRWPAAAVLVVAGLGLWLLGRAARTPAPLAGNTPSGSPAALATVAAAPATGAKPAERPAVPAVEATESAAAAVPSHELASPDPAGDSAANPLARSTPARRHSRAHGTQEIAARDGRQIRGEHDDRRIADDREDKNPGPAAVSDPPPVARVITRPAPSDPMKEAERLLGQGDIAGACDKGEDQLLVTPSAAPVYKFLGKCYMRAGQPTKAMANYRRYLELAPNASDAAFIRSIVR